METQLYLLNIGHLLQQDHEDLLRKVNYITGNVSNIHQFAA